MRSAAGEHPLLTIGIVIGIIIGITMWTRGRGRRLRGHGGVLNGSGGSGGFLRLDGKESLLGGGASNGKVD